MMAAFPWSRFGLALLSDRVLAPSGAALSGCASSSGVVQADVSTSRGADLRGSVAGQEAIPQDVRRRAKMRPRCTCFATRSPFRYCFWVLAAALLTFHHGFTRYKQAQKASVTRHAASSPGCRYFSGQLWSGLLEGGNPADGIKEEGVPYRDK